MKDDNINEPLIKKITGTEDNLEEGEENEHTNLLGKKMNTEIIMKNRIISKIYFLFFIQLCINFLFIYYSFTNEKFHKLLEKNNDLFYLSIGITAIIFFFSFKNRTLLTTIPFNYFFFIVFTLSLSYLICRIVILFTYETILVLWILILIMVLSLSIYSYNLAKKIQITSAVVFSSLSTISFSVIIKFVSKLPIINIILILLCLICLSIYLVYDVISLIEEKAIENKNYILVNVFLYTDIIKLFIKLIRMITKYFESSEEIKNLKKVADDLDRGFNDVKTLGKKNDDSDEDSDSEDDDSDDDDSDSDDKKGKGKKDNKKGGKGKKDDKGKKNDKGKKDDKGKKNNKGKKNDKDKKNDKGKKDKKEDKKDKGKSKSKKEEKKKGKKEKEKKSKKKDHDFFDEEDTNNFVQKAGEMFADMFSH